MTSLFRIKQLKKKFVNSTVPFYGPFIKSLKNFIMRKKIMKKLHSYNFACIKSLKTKKIVVC